MNYHAALSELTLATLKTEVFNIFIYIISFWVIVVILDYSQKLKPKMYALMKELNLNNKL